MLMTRFCRFLCSVTPWGADDSISDFSVLVGYLSVHKTRDGVVEPARLLTAQEVEYRVCDYFGGHVVDHLAQKVH
jgi:hypothetical protein